jgi:hypothetical protein
MTHQAQSWGAGGALLGTLNRACWNRAQSHPEWGWAWVEECRGSTGTSPSGGGPPRARGSGGSSGGSLSQGPALTRRRVVEAWTAPWAVGASSAFSAGCCPWCLSLPHLSLVPGEGESRPTGVTGCHLPHHSVFRVAQSGQRGLAMEMEGNPWPLRMATRGPSAQERKQGLLCIVWPHWSRSWVLSLMMSRGCSLLMLLFGGVWG